MTVVDDAIDAGVEEARVDELMGVEDAEVTVDSADEVSVLRADEDTRAELASSIEVVLVEDLTSEDGVEELLAGADVASAEDFTSEVKVLTAFSEEALVRRLVEKRLKEKFGSSVVAFADGAAVIMEDVAVRTGVDVFANSADVEETVKFDAAVVLTPIEELARAVLLASAVVLFRNDGTRKLVVVVFKGNEAEEHGVVAFRYAGAEGLAVVVFRGGGVDKLALVVLAEAF